MGATTATRVGDGADCLFLGGNAGGLEETENPGKRYITNKSALDMNEAFSTPNFHTPVLLLPITLSMPKDPNQKRLFPSHSKSRLFLLDRDLGRAERAQSV